MTQKLKRSNSQISQNEEKEHHDWKKRQREEELKRFQEIEEFGLEQLQDDPDEHTGT